MTETELKFQVDARQRAALRRALGADGPRPLRLRALYFDTPDRRLAAQGVALRLRLEGAHWVQTLKATDGGAASPRRLEHEVPRHSARAREAPALDLALHDGTEAGRRLAQALGGGAAPLAVTFETDVRRTVRLLRARGTTVEVAFDEGELRSGARREPIRELEFELKGGSVAGLVAQVRRWVPAHRLWLDPRSKAERGDLLARGIAVPPPVVAGASSLRAGMSPDAALRTMVADGLSHALPNAAALAAGASQPEHVHQLRVALRRLRSALRVFGRWSPAADSRGEPALAAVFAALGSARDRDALAETLLPALVAAGAPLAELPPEGDDAPPGPALREPQVNLLWLELSAFAHGAPEDAAAQAGDAAARRSRQPIRSLHRRLVADGEAFARLDDDARHRARKRLKRLRYVAEFVAPLHADRPLRRYLARLRRAQEALGELNDLGVADAAFRRLLPADGRAAFAIAWIAERRAVVLRRAGKALRALRDAPRFWRTR